MSNFKPNYFQRRSKPQGPRANERIRALDVQVIGSDGGNLGTMPLNKAIELAKQESLDLIEISPNANPPVCKIMQEMEMIMSEIRLVSDVANELKNDLRQDVRRIEKVVNDVEQMVKEDSRETSSELRSTTKDMKEDMAELSNKLESAMTALEEKIEKRIKLALENPLSQMK